MCKLGGVTEHLASWWDAPTALDPVCGEVSLPGSKSITNRELVLAALAKGTSVLRRPLLARDTKLMIAGLQSMGVQVSTERDELRVTPGELHGPSSIDCGLAGTVMRFLPPIAALAQGSVEFYADPEAQLRPMATTLNSLRALGVEVSSENASLPFTVHGTGKVRGGELSIDASRSSQFISGLLLAAARFDEGINLHHTGDQLPSLPHIEMTLDCLRRRGVSASQESPANWRIEPGEIRPLDLVIEPDLSNAGPFLAAAVVTGGTVAVADWPAETTQVGREFIPILEQFGARCELAAGWLKVTGPQRIKGVDLNLEHAGELAPTIAAIAALAETPSRLVGIAHLRGHETDRLAALTREINNLGGAVSELQDGLVINPRPLHAGNWASYHDHRMATAGAIIGLRVPGVKVENIATTQKTIPNFQELWSDLLRVASQQSA